MYFVCIVDVNECALDMTRCTCNGLVGCYTTCTNDDGSYTCGCSPGFDVDLDRITCQGTLTFSLYVVVSKSAKVSYCSFLWQCYCMNHELAYSLLLFCLGIDVDECVNLLHGCSCTPAGCEYYCWNNIGSYTCSCSAGFMIDNDGETCIGKSSSTILNWVHNLVSQVFCTWHSVCSSSTL